MNKTRHKLITRPEKIPLVIILTVLLVFNSCEDLLKDSGSGDARDRLVDTWKVEESPGSYKASLVVYWAEILKHPDDTTKLIIENFYNVDADAEGILSGNTITLPLQDIMGGFEISGSGKIMGSKSNEIIWTYFVDDGSGDKINVTEIYTRLTF